MEAFLNYSRPDTYGIKTTDDVLVPMRDGRVLTCDLYQPAVPDGSQAPGRFPGIVNNYAGYGRRQVVSIIGVDLRSFAAKGYNVIWCNPYGAQGLGGTSPAPHSVGPLEPWQPREQRDNYDLIEWMASQPWSTGQIGQVGMSYAGITTWLVAGRQQPPHLRAIIPVEASNDNYTQMTYPGGIRTMFDTRGLWGRACDVLTGEPTCSVRIPQWWDAHPTFDDFWANQRVDTSRVTIPTLQVEGLQDFFIGSVDAAYPNMAQHDNYRLLLGPWGHSTPETATGKGVLTTGIYLAWFDRWLRGDSDAPMPPKVIAYQQASNSPQGWIAAPKWPVDGAMKVQFNLAEQGQMVSSSSPPQGSASYSVALGGDSGSVSFTTAPLTGPLSVVSGPVDVVLPVKTSATDGNIIASLSEVAADGTVTPLGPSGYLKLSHRYSDVTPQPMIPNSWSTIRVQVPSEFWNLAAGSRLRLTITSADNIVARDAAPGEVSIGYGPEAFIALRMAEPRDVSPEIRTAPDPSTTTCGTALSWLPVLALFC